MIQRYIHEIKWALIFIVALILWVFAERLLGFHSVRLQYQALVSGLFTLVAVLIYVLALGQKRQQYYLDHMTWQQGFYCGFIITLIITILTPLVQLLIHTVVTPHFLTNMITYTAELEGIEPAAAAVRYNLGSYVIQAMLSALVMGIVLSAIIAFFVRTRLIRTGV